MTRKYCAFDFRHVRKHVGMSQSATPATRNEATRRLKLPEMTTFAKFAIGTAIATSRERLRTGADANATLSEHTLNPQIPGVKREPVLRIREKGFKMMVLCYFVFRCPAE